MRRFRWLAPKVGASIVTASVAALAGPLDPGDVPPRSTGFGTYVAPPAIAMGIGLMGFSTLPCGVVLVFIPLVLVGDTWPVVRP